MLETAIEAAAEAGKLLRKNFGANHAVTTSSRHDIKLELDEQAQARITRVILADYPRHAILGEEGSRGDVNAEVRWIVDPLDGTVNYWYNIPHYAVSIAAQRRAGIDIWETVTGVVFAPELDEMFTAEKGQPAFMNGKVIHVSDRDSIAEAVIAMGFFKSTETINRSLDDFRRLIHRVRKIRLMGAAALDAVYVACGRFDAYIEYGIKLWDIAAGQLILECAGGSCLVTPCEEAFSLDVRMWNGKLSVQELTEAVTV